MHASGISVDETVAEQFATAKLDPSVLFLQYKIANDKFQQIATGTRTDSRANDIAVMKETLKDNEPCFFVARPQPSPQSHAKDLWQLIFYMPDGCTVRDRMIYSSSSAALRDGLGSQSFAPNTWNVRSSSQFTLEDFADSQNTSVNVNELMTNDEIERLEADKSSHLAMASTKIAALVGMPVQATEQSIAAIERVKSESGYCAILKLDGESEKMHVDEEGVMSFEEISKRLTPNEPRYILTNFAHTHDGEQAQAHVFHYYCPDALKPKLKMFYSTCKSVAVKQCEALGCSITRSIEVSDRSEISSNAVLESLYPQSAVKKAFKKPAKPGRGPARLIGASPSPEPASSPSP